LAVSPQSAAAAEAATREVVREHLARARAEQDHRRMNGHRFQIPEFVPASFSITAFALAVGLEQHSVPGFVQLPPATVQTTLVKLESLNVVEAADFSVRLHDYIMLFVQGYGSARVGSNRPTLLSTGVDYAYGGNFGVLAKLLSTEAFRLAVRGYVGG